MHLPQPKPIADPREESLVDPQEQCNAVVADQNRSRADKAIAALLYYHGTQVGQKCLEIDYVRAFALLREAREARIHASLLEDLQPKAASGLPLTSGQCHRHPPRCK